MPRDRKALWASAAIVGAAVLACAAVIGRYRQQKTELEQFLLVPMNGPMLFSHPGGEPYSPSALSLLLGRPAAYLARMHALVCILARGIHWRLVRAGGALSRPSSWLAPPSSMRRTNREVRGSGRSAERHYAQLMSRGTPSKSASSHRWF